MTNFKYWAFISYSHQDNRQPDGWADWLHDAIEHFPVPSEFVGKPGRHGEPIPDRLYPVFQDEKELPSAGDLGESIRDALAESRHLIVICSPSAARSTYVNEEIREFKRLGRASRILAIIVEGEPNASEPGSIAEPSLECFPPALRHPLRADGAIDPAVRADPIAADIRGLADNPALLEREKLRLIAGLLDVGFDDLVQREKERQLREERAKARRLRKLVAAFAALAALAVVAGIIALAARQQSQKNLADARRRLAQIYVERAEAAYHARDLSQQALLLAEARVLDPGSVSASVVADLAQRTAGVKWVVNAGADAGEIRALAMSPDEQTAVLLTNAGRLIEIDAATGSAQRDTNVNLEGVSALAIAPDGGSLAIAHLGSDGKGNLAGVISILDRRSLQPRQTLKRHIRLVVSVQFANGGDTLLSTSDDRTAIVWDVRQGRVIRELIGHTGDVNGIAASADGRLLATASSDSTVGIWSAADGSLLTRFNAHDADVSTVLLTPDDTRLVTSGGDATIRVWDVESRRNIRQLRGHDGSITVTRLSKDGHTLLSAGADQTIRLWDLRSGQLRQRLTGHTGWVVDARLLGGGRSAISAERYGRVIRWTLPEDADAMDLAGGGVTTRRGAFAAGGTLAATAADDGLVRLWTLPTGKLAAQWPGHQAAITGLAFLDGGRSLLTASHDETLRIWDTSSHAEKARLAGHSSLIWTVALDPAGTHALSGGADRDLRLWNLRTYRLEGLLAPTRETVNTVAFSADGTYAASGSNDRLAIVWRLESRSILKVLRHQGQVSSVMFSSGGVLATAAWGDAVRLWRSQDFQELRRLSCGAAGCDAVAFSPDGRVLVGGGLDGALRVWDAGTGQELRRIPAHIGRIYSVSVSPDGQHVLTTGLNGVARLWNLDVRSPQLLQPPPENDESLLRRIRLRTGLELREGRVVLPDSTAR